MGSDLTSGYFDEAEFDYVKEIEKSFSRKSFGLDQNSYKTKLHEMDEEMFDYYFPQTGINVNKEEAFKIVVGRDYRSSPERASKRSLSVFINRIKRNRSVIFNVVIFLAAIATIVMLFKEFGYL